MIIVRPTEAVTIIPMRAVLSAADGVPNSATPSQMEGFVADTSTYPESVVTSNAIIIDGSGTGTFIIQAHMFETNSATATAHLRKNGVQIGPTYVNNPGGTGAGATITSPFGGTFTATVSDGDLITMWVSTQASTSNRRLFDPPANNFFTILP